MDSSANFTIGTKSMHAIISDLHSNIEALNAIMADVASFNVDELVCLGDVIGYGPNPRECLEIVRRCRFTLLGNHEEGLMGVAEDFNDRARRALDWTRKTLNSPAFPKEQNYAFWEQIDGFEQTHKDADALYVHGSPRDPVREYVMPADALDHTKMTEIFELIDCRVCFAGHTHVPGIFTPDRGFMHQSEFKGRVKLPPKSFVNVGSAGQPRDGDNRACYTLVDGDEIEFRRVKYDIPGTMKKIKAIPELDDFLANRLMAGK